MEYAGREHLLAIADSLRDAIISKDLNGVITSWNSGAQVIFGYTPEEIIGTSITQLIPDDRRDEEDRLLAGVRHDGRLELLETQRQTKDGRLIDVSITLAPIRDVAGCVIGVSNIARDITLLKQREREISRLSRLYAALSQINHTIVRTPDRDELFRRVCRILVEHGGFRMAAIGWHIATTRRIVPLAIWGDVNPDLQSVEIYSDDRPEGRGPSGTAFRTARPCICNDLLADPNTLPWRAILERHGYRSSVSLPIRLQGDPCAVLSVYADQRDFFHDKEMALLEEVAADVSFALDNAQRDEARRQAELKLRSEKHFSDTMIESMPGIVYFYDSNGRFLRWNRNFETVSGYSPLEIASMHPLDFFAGADKVLLEQRIGAVFTQGEASVEADFVTRDGSIKPYFFTGRRVEFEGKPCLVGVGVDVSARRLAEQRVAESERKYRELVEYANSIILRWNAEGEITFLNEFGQHFFGYTGDEIMGRHVIGTIVPETETSGRDLSGLMSEICAAPAAFERNINENIRRNGERVWIEWTNRIVSDAAGKVVEILSIGTDITGRKHAEEARLASESRYRKLFECAPDGIVIANPQSYYLDANASICRMLGYSREEFIGLHASDIVEPDEIPRIEPTLQDINNTAEHQREWRFRRKDGSVFNAEVLATLMPDGNILGMIRDITDRKLVEAEREKRHRAEAADRIKSAFLAAMSHELRTPLNSIIGFTGIILQGLAGPLNEEQGKQLDMVRSSARHLLALVNDVLDISKIEAGQLDVASKRFDVRKSIDKVMSLVAPQAEAKQLGLKVEINAALGEMLNDERRFEQILLNLLSNAIKFTEHGSVTLQAQSLDEFIFPGTDSGKTAMRVRVSDTGIGIKPEDMPLLFQPFQQIESGLTRQHDGTGLGLAISRRLATLMGGAIDAESEWGKGSVFTVTLPSNAQAAGVMS
jgi:PAS domain S-box-containing protein